MFELAKKRRSIRKYTSENVNEQTLGQLLKLGLLAPSSWGKTPVEFIVIDEKEKLQKLAVCRTHNAPQLKEASVGIAVIIDKSQGDFWIEDGTVAATYLLLGAEQLGLGACWVQIRGMDGDGASAEEIAKQMLNIPNHYCLLCVVSLGYKGEEKTARTEDSLEFSNIHRNTYKKW